MKAKTTLISLLLAACAVFTACAANSGIHLQTRSETPSSERTSISETVVPPSETASETTPAATPTPETPTPETPTLETPTPETPTVEPPRPFTMAFTGDISYAETYYNGKHLSSHLGVYNHAVKKGWSLDDLISDDMLERMRSADFLVVNCESSVSDRGESLGNQGKTYTFRTSPETAKMFEKIGADLVGLANNHTYDFGEEAFLDTLDFFAGLGIPTVGAGRNADEAYAPYYYDAPNGMKIAIIATSRAEQHYYTLVAGDDTPGICGCYVPEDKLSCPYGEERVLESIREAKNNADFVIVYPHFGNEATTKIQTAQKNAAHHFIDAGADLVIGAHSHCLQGIEAYNGKMIFYSLGNYLFNLTDVQTALLELTFDENKELGDLRLVTAMQKDGKVIGEIGTSKGQTILEDMRKLSPTVDIDDEGYVSIK